MPRRAVGPLVIALSAWCAAGTVTVASAESAGIRLVSPAPWWVFVLSFALAALIPAWRRSPSLSSVALFSTLPWWPVPVPAAALIWTGPLAWLPIGCAFAGAIGIGPVAAAARLIRANDCRRAMTLAGTLTIAASSCAVWSVAPLVPSGDEPHYLIIAQSLLRDGDLRVENNYRDGDYREYYGGDLRPDYLVRGRNGQIYSIHMPGLGVLLAPAYALLGYRGAGLLLILLAGVTGSLIWRIAWRATGETDAAWFAWASIVGSATFLLHSFAVFPDGPAALIFAAAILLLLRLRMTPDQVGLRALVVVSVLLASLPWLHSRLVVLACGAGAAIVWTLLSDTSRAWASRRARAATFVALPVAGAIGWFAFFQVVYGTPNPAVPYGSATAMRAAYIPGGVLALLLDGQFGLFAYSPVLIVAAFGLWRIGEGRVRRIVLACGISASAYLAAVAAYWMWWAGQPANPARFTTAILPVFAMPLALAWSRSDTVRRKLWLALLGVTATISALLLSVDDGNLAWNLRTAEPRWLEWLGPVANLPRAWPSFFWRLTDALSSEVAFAGHAAIWLTAYGALWLVVRASLRTDVRHANLAVAVWLIVGVMTTSSLGWWINGVSGLDPGRSQLKVIAMARAGRPLVRLAPLEVHRATIDGVISVRSEEPGRTDAPPPWVDLLNVPPGRYDVHISTSRPVRGDLTMFLGAGPEPVRILRVEPLSRQILEMDLPNGAIELTLIADPTLASVGHIVELVPRAGSR